MPHFGHDFGMTPFGLEQVAARVRVYPFSGTCAYCGRDRDDLFYHRQDDAFYCADVFRCEARREILERTR